MGAIKRELHRLADIVIYGNAETIAREFDKVGGLHDQGALGLLAYAVETARDFSPLCECGADYHAELFNKWPQIVENTNREATQ
jgi:c-di-GMP-related signal transduction protein